MRPPAVVTKQTGDLGDGEVKWAVACDAGDYTRFNPGYVIDVLRT